jgi:hypothetical protein
LQKERDEMQNLMSKFAAHIRDINEVRALVPQFEKKLSEFFENNIIFDKTELNALFKNRDLLISAIALLKNIEYSSAAGSRGSGLILAKNGERVLNFNYALGNGQFDDKVIIYKNGKLHQTDVAPIPNADDWFERVWKEFEKRTSNK